MVLIKALIKPFYQAHAGFFFLLFFIAGGFMRSNEHIALANYIAESNLLTAIIIVTFTLYHLKTYRFTKALLRSDEYVFIRNIGVQRLRTQLISLGAVYCAQSIVVIIYGLFVGSFMISKGFHFRGGVLLLYFLGSALIFSILIIQQLKYPVYEFKANFISRYWNEKFYLPIVLWYPFHLLKNRPLLLLLTKLLSIGILTLCFSAYDATEYDLRYLGISIVAATSVNLVLSHSFFEFYISKLSTLRSLPIGKVQRILMYLLNSILLLLPEMLVMMRKLPPEASAFYIWQSMVFVITNFLFYVHFAIFFNAGIERMGKVCLFITLLQVYLVLFGLPLYVLSLAMLPFIVAAQKRFYLVHDY